MATKHRSSRAHSDFMFETLETPHSDRVESTFLIDLRRQSRFDTHFPGQAVAESGEHVYVTIADISLSGLRLEGSQQTVGTLLANFDGRTPDTDSQAPLEVNFSVPTDSDYLAPVKVHGSIVYSRRAKKDSYQIGVKFVTFEEGRAALAEYLAYRKGSSG